MNAIKALLLGTMLAVASVGRAGEWPLYFDATTKDGYDLIILHERGRAQYFSRFVRVDARGRSTNDVFLLHDDSATWGYFPNQQKNARPNIWVQTKQFRFDYYLETARLTQIEKTGAQRILTKRKNANPEVR